MGVQLTTKQRNEAEETLKNFLESNNIKLTIPVDVFKLATELGFDVRGAAFGSAIEGMILVNEKLKKITGFNSNKIIGYNCESSIEDKKFIVGHEIAHYIDRKKNTDRKVVFAFRDHSDGYSKDLYEQTMDYISAALLVPREDLKTRYADKSQADSKEIARIYNVDLELAKRRIEEVYE